jgi:hypothetical protein
MLPLVEFWASADPAQMILPPSRLAVPAQTKTELSRQPRTIHLTTAAPAEAVVRSVRRLRALYLLEVDPVSQSVSLDAPVLRATSGVPLSTASALQLCTAMHSFWRGAAQDAFAKDISRAHGSYRHPNT